MNLRKSKGEGAEVAAEAMNDIMFFLMLFFLIVSTLANPNVIKLAVPNSSKAKRELNNRTPLILHVDKEADHVLYIIDKSEVKKESLESRLKMEMKGLSDPMVVVDAGDELSIQDLVDVLSLGEKMQIKMVFK
jgi:biopolymer transport protein ExbD